MNFRQVVNDLARTASVSHAQAAIREAHGKAATRWLADEAGISPRTARRWMSANPPAGRVSTLKALVDAASVAAQRIRHASSISVGTVAVTYDDEDQGTRTIGDLMVDDYMAAELGDAADALESGDWDAAEDAFSNAVIGGYSDGLQDTLTVADYSHGVALGG